MPSHDRGENGVWCEEQGHRAEVFKQKNKEHKHGKHRTKEEIERENKGRVSVTALTKKQRREKLDKRHKANQLRQNKKDLVLAEKRSLGSRDGPPHLVAVVALHAGVNAEAVTRLLRCEEAGGLVREEKSVCGVSDSFGLVMPRFKQRFTFLCPDTADMHTLLDVVKVADSLVFVLDSTEGWDSYGDYCLSCLFAQGLPTHALVCQGVSDLAVKKRVDSRWALAKISEIRFPGARLFPLDSDQDATLMLRHLGAQRQRRLGFRSRRPHLLAQQVSYTPNSSEMGSGGAPMGLGTLRVSGYVRGCPLQVDRLVHISGFGDFQLSQIDAPIDPLPLNSMTARPAKPGKEGDVGMQDGGVDEVASVRVLMKADPARRESLQAEAEVDPMDGEQTWSSDTELLEAEEARKSKRVMKVPKGTSDYQATWIVDEEDEVSTDDEEDDAMMDESIDGEDLDSQVDAASGCGSNEYEDDEDEEELNSTSDKGGSDQRYDEHMDEAEEGEGLKRYREARANEMFPDEVDTPLDQSAKNRFQRYRGLKSFRSSPWDPMENLPADYSHIFQFQSFERTRRRILAEAAQEEEGAWWAGM
ncbi:hypothetical protein J4Q44_G00328220 [Coregonus suidteri]|uniref:Pre-rRNA-processing protein TSR1 homolog n=1 Tax=Coregonus suidteri TaxID=861788 RepID=A0AAN8L391_9TELE